MSAPRWRRRRVAASIAAGALALLARGVARAQQAWPGKLVRIIVPYTPGTGMDILARTLGPHLGSAWGQAIVVDNRPGASGNLGAAAVAKAPPDGLTLLMGVNTLIINPALYANMSYDPLKDLAPIGLCATGSFLLVASAAAKIRSVDELVKAARAKPGALDYASPGIATPHHMAMELFKLEAKVSITHIPFSGTAGAVSALLAGDVPLMFLPVHVAMAQVKGGRLVVLAAAGAHRSALAPDVPTLAELGYRRRRGRPVVRHARPRRHRARDHPEGQRRHDARAGARRGQERARRARHGGRAELARGDGGADAQRRRALGGGRQARRHQG